MDLGVPCVVFDDLALSERILPGEYVAHRVLPCLVLKIRP